MDSRGFAGPTTQLLLATNLFEQPSMPEQFAQLYRARWRIEEAFKLIKARLQVENWSGILPHTVEQDFYASVARANCAAVLAWAARPQDAALNPEAGLDDRGWRQRLNRTLTLKSLRHYLPRLLLAMDLSTLIEGLLERLRSPSAIERTRRKGVRIADHHCSYKAA